MCQSGTPHPGSSTRTQEARVEDPWPCKIQTEPFRDIPHPLSAVRNDRVKSPLATSPQAILILKVKPGSSLKADRVRLSAKKRPRRHPYLRESTACLREPKWASAETSF